MEMIFLNVFNRSLAAGWLILAVIVVRFLLKKAPRRLSCVLWAVVAVRLLCPFFPVSSFSLIPSGETISAEVVRFAPAPAIDSGIPALNEALNPMIGERFAQILFSQACFLQIPLLLRALHLDGNRWHCLACGRRRDGGIRVAQQPADAQRGTGGCAVGDVCRAARGQAAGDRGCAAG